LDIVAKDLTVALGSAFAQAFAAFALTEHWDEHLCWCEVVVVGFYLFLMICFKFIIVFSLF
jgi:hypothetical protein